jgi:uncharacterized membrane protein YjjP (DUF1212 family)
VKARFADTARLLLRRTSAYRRDWQDFRKSRARRAAAEPTDDTDENGSTGGVMDATFDEVTNGWDPRDDRSVTNLHGDHPEDLEAGMLGTEFSQDLRPEIPVQTGRERKRRNLFRPARPHWTTGLRHHRGNGAHEDEAVSGEAIDPAPGPSVPDDAHVLQVMDLAIQVGEVMLSSGEAVAETTATMLRIADNGGLPSTEVDITFTSITMSCHRGKVALPVTTMRLVHHRSLDLTRLDQVARVVSRLEQAKIDLVTAASALEDITAAKHPYPRWLATLAWASMAASVAALYGAGWAAALVAFAATGAIDRIGRLLNRNGLPLIFQQVCGALLATGFTATLMYFRVLPVSTATSLVIAAAITVLLSGLSVVSAVRDAIDGFPLTAAGRAGEIAMYSAGLLAGVVLALKAASHFGIELAVDSPLPATTGAGLLRILAAGGASGFFALASYAPLRYLPGAFGVGIASWGFYTLFQYADFGPVASTGMAAIGLGAFAGNLHRYLGVPSLVLTVAGVTPLLPGFTAYRGFYQLAVAGVTEGLVTIMLALATGLALAGGVALGEWMTSRMRNPLMGPQRRGSSSVGQ